MPKTEADLRRERFLAQTAELDAKSRDQWGPYRDLERLAGFFRLHTLNGQTAESIAAGPLRVLSALVRHICDDATDWALPEDGEAA